MAHASEERHLVTLEAHPGAPAVSETAPSQLLSDLLGPQREAGRDPLEDRHESLAVGLSCGQEPEHRAKGSCGPAGDRRWLSGQNRNCSATAFGRKSGPASTTIAVPSARKGPKG